MQTFHKKQHSARNAQLRSGFTLIELLVVIAIIAILAAILFPVFARARENARRASCQSNLKQIALGVFQYKQDYDEKLPRTGTSYANYFTYGNPYGWADATQPYLKSTQILQCPSETNGPATGTTTFGDSPPAHALNYNDYFMNTAALGAADATFNAPALTVLLGDSLNGNAANRSDGCSLAYADQSYTTTGSACTTAQSYITNFTNLAGTVGALGRHLDGANYAFADGHVKWLKGSIIGGGTVINGSTAIGNRLYTTDNGQATFSTS
jgi:prepilin-type N-terminal cleavage/methylation domain-containing protein/prepilin-type processing-associated H-X9-DG protein